MLVVDDDFMVARIHSGYVARVPGFTVVDAAHTGGAAIAAVAEHGPDLVLLDIYLPDMSGLDVLKALRGASHPVDVLMITAARDVATVRAAMRGGAVNYLIKPFTAGPSPNVSNSTPRPAGGSPAIGSEARQDEVDSLFGLAKGGPPPLPKGLSAPTCALVADALKASGTDLSAAEAAVLTGLSRVSARRYLEYLCAVGRPSSGRGTVPPDGPNTATVGRDDRGPRVAGRAVRAASRAWGPAPGATPRPGYRDHPVPVGGGSQLLLL